MKVEITRGKEFFDHKIKIDGEEIKNCVGYKILDSVISTPVIELKLLYDELWFVGEQEEFVTEESISGLEDQELKLLSNLIEKEKEMRTIGKCKNK